MTNFTNEQLEAWAGLGPWCQPDGPEYGVMLDRVPSRPIHCFLGQPIFDKQPHDDWFKQEMANAALIAAAPDLARLVLEKDAEIARLKAAIQDIAENWEWWNEDRHDRCSSVVGDSIAEAEQAMKGDEKP